jgi:hypothetical protein
MKLFNPKLEKPATCNTFRYYVRHTRINCAEHGPRSELTVAQSEPILALSRFPPCWNTSLQLDGTMC